MNCTNEKFDSVTFKAGDLEGATFTDCQFLRCDFSRGMFSEASFINCDFYDKDERQGCDFSYADLRDASFKNCKLNLAMFTGANLFGAEFRDCDLQGANFYKANFANLITQRSYFCSVFITGCNLTYTNFERQKLEKCDLFENRWRGANLVGAILNGSDLSRGEFSGDSWGDFSFENCDLTNVDLTGLDPRRVSLSGVKICDWQQEQLLEPFGIIVMPS